MSFFYVLAAIASHNSKNQNEKEIDEKGNPVLPPRPRSSLDPADIEKYNISFIGQEEEDSVNYHDDYVTTSTRASTSALLSDDDIEKYKIRFIGGETQEDNGDDSGNRASVPHGDTTGSFSRADIHKYNINFIGENVAQASFDDGDDDRNDYYRGDHDDERDITSSSTSSTSISNEYIAKYKINFIGDAHRVHNESGAAHHDDNGASNRNNHDDTEYSEFRYQLKAAEGTRRGHMDGQDDEVECRNEEPAADPRYFNDKALQYSSAIHNTRNCRVNRIQRLTAPRRGLDHSSCSTLPTVIHKAPGPHAALSYVYGYEYFNALQSMTSYNNRHPMIRDAAVGDTTVCHYVVMAVINAVAAVTLGLVRFV